MFRIGIVAFIVVQKVTSGLVLDCYRPDSKDQAAWDQIQWKGCCYCSSMLGCFHCDFCQNIPIVHGDI